MITFINRLTAVVLVLNFQCKDEIAEGNSKMAIMPLLYADFVLAYSDKKCELAQISFSSATCFFVCLGVFVPLENFSHIS